MQFRFCGDIKDGSAETCCYNASTALPLDWDNCARIRAVTDFIGSENAGDYCKDKVHARFWAFFAYLTLVVHVLLSLYIMLTLLIILQRQGSGVLRHIDLATADGAASLQEQLTAAPREGELTTNMFLQQLRLAKQIIEVQDVELVRKVGQGAFGVVYHARVHQTDYACKSLGADSEDSGELVARLDEVVRARNIVHPNVVQFLGMARGALHNAEHALSHVWLMMEFCSAGDLYSWLHDRERELNTATRLRALHDVARGLLFVHEQHGMAHLDLKSNNVLIHSSGAAKIADFGIHSALLQNGATPASSFDESTPGEYGVSAAEAPTFVTLVGSLGAAQQPSNIAGTPEWMAPEMYLRGVRTKAVDLFSFGVFMWELLCRERPYKGYCSDSSLSPQSVVALVPMWASCGRRPDVPACPGSSLQPVPADTQPIQEPRGMPPQTFRCYVALMQRCWEEDPAARPTMCDVATKLEDMSQQLARPNGEEAAGGGSATTTRPGTC